MGLSIRKATLHDVQRLWEIRRQAILELGPRGMPVARAQAWAATMTIQGMEKRFRDAEIWLAESSDAIVGWIAVRGDYIDGLYTDPQFADQGVGSALLNMAEMLMRDRGIQAVRLDSSVNAEQFYRRRGYELNGPATADNAIPLTKSLWTMRV